MPITPIMPASTGGQPGLAGYEPSARFSERPFLKGIIRQRMFELVRSEHPMFSSGLCMCIGPLTCVHTYIESPALNRLTMSFKVEEGKKYIKSALARGLMGKKPIMNQVWGQGACVQSQHMHRPEFKSSLNYTVAKRLSPIPNPKEKPGIKPNMDVL